MDGGAWSETDDNHADKVEKGTTLQEPVAPIKSGATFEGWYKEAALTNKITFPVTVTGDLKLYAKWGVFTDDSNLKKAAYCLAYIYEITEKKKKGQNVSSISGVCNVFNKANGTINYVSFSSYTSLTAYNYNTPMMMGSTTSSQLNEVFSSRSRVLKGTYDFANDPAQILVYFGSFSGSLIFSVNELDGLSTLSRMKIAANNNSIDVDVISKIRYPNNSYKVIIFGKNKSGEAIGKYTGYTTDGANFIFLRLDPDNPKFGQMGSMEIP